MLINRILMVSAFVGFTAGCESSTWKVVCDSGFETPVSQHAYVADGVILWKVFENSNVRERKMLPGEVCTTYRFRNGVKID